jgi:hypothetical protein
LPAWTPVAGKQAGKISSSSSSSSTNATRAGESQAFGCRRKRLACWHVVLQYSGTPPHTHTHTSAVLSWHAA